MAKAFVVGTKTFTSYKGAKKYANSLSLASNRTVSIEYFDKMSEARLKAKYGSGYAAPYQEEFINVNRTSNPSSNIDTQSARELVLFIENDGQLYRSQHQPIQKNLITKMAKGVYKHNLAVKLFGYLVDNGAKKYAKEFASASDWNKIFDKATRVQAAEELTDSFENEAKYGNYDNFLPKKYQKQSNPSNLISTSSNTNDTEGWLPCHAIRQTPDGSIQLLTEKGALSNPAKKKAVLSKIRKMFKGVGKAVLGNPRAGAYPPLTIKTIDVPGVSWKKYGIYSGKNYIDGPYYSKEEALKAKQRIIAKRPGNRGVLGNPGKVKSFRINKVYRPSLKEWRGYVVVAIDSPNGYSVPGDNTYHIHKSDDTGKWIVETTRGTIVGSKYATSFLAIAAAKKHAKANL